jgi:hypothetical protein
MVDFLLQVALHIWWIVKEAAVFLLFGFALAGVLAILVPARTKRCFFHTMKAGDEYGDDATRITMEASALAFVVSSARPSGALWPFVDSPGVNTCDSPADVAFTLGHRRAKQDPGTDHGHSR